MYVIIPQSPGGVTEALVCECALLSPLQGSGILGHIYRALPEIMHDRYQSLRKKELAIVVRLQNKFCNFC